MRNVVPFDPEDFYSSAIPPHQRAAAAAPHRPTGDLLADRPGLAKPAVKHRQRQAPD